MKGRSVRIPRAVVAGLVAGLLCCWPAAEPQAQLIVGSTSTSTAFAGQAAAVSGFAGGSLVSVANTTALSASGGAQEASAMETAVGGLAVGESHAAVVGAGSATASEASAANVSFAGGSSFFGGAATTIAADFVMARGTVNCVSGVATASGVVQITGLVINGQAVAVTGAANQMVFLSDGGFVIINEQLATAAGVTVNAMHVIDAMAGVNVVIASASAGITCGGTTTSPAPPCDFVTGGGWIVGTPSGAKGNFGVAGGIKNGAFWGHLNYIDHGNGMHVKHTAVTGYAVDPNDPDCRIIDYNVTINGAPGTARVRVCDKGEPGRDDIFEIQLSNGYFAGGDLGGSHPGGGNIQLHKCH